MSISIARSKFITAVISALALLASMAPIQAYAVEARSNYLVIVKPGTDVQMRKAIAALGEKPLDELDYVLDGFTLNLTEADANALSIDPNVLQVIPDTPVQLFGTDAPPASWGLDRIDQTPTALDSKYEYPDSAGQGVRVYVVDTGVQLDNPEFTGRTLPGFDATGSGNTTTDCHGHATHVAGTIAGTKFGVAKKATIISVKVLSCAGTGSTTGVVSGLDWIAANHPKGTPGVINMSIGGSSNSTLNAAVERLSALGILNVVAAGNDNNDACYYSPASATSAITVGASDSRDAKASFSNFGNCVDVFAPGTSIISARASDPNGSVQMNGTSMATPHVAGLAALYFAQNPSATVAQTTAAIRAGGILNAINNAQSANGNILVNNGFTRGLAAPAPNPNPVINAPDAPTNLELLATSTNSVTVRWVAPQYDGGSPVMGYRLLYKVNGVLYWSSVGISGSTQYTLSPLNAGTTYQLKVGAYNSVGSGLYSSEIKATTQVGIPSAPEALTAVAGPSMIQLSWKAPAVNTGSPVANYVVQQLQGTTWATVATPTETTALISGLTTGTAYKFRVYSQNASGTSTGGASIDVATNTTNIPAPQNVVVSAPTAVGATISWDAVSSPSAMAVTSYLVTAKLNATGASVTQEVTGTSYTFSTLTSNSVYSITVTAKINQVIGVASAPVTLNTAANVPTAPQTLRIVLSGSATYLMWNVPLSTGGSAITGYQVQKLSAGLWINHASTVSRSILIQTPLIGQSDSYRVIAKNVNGFGDPSNVLVVSGRAIPASAPLELAASTIDASGKVTLSWKAPDIDGGAAVTAYQVYVNKGSSSVWEAVASTSKLTLLTFAPLKGATWKYRVAAVNSAGVGAPSAEVSVSSPKGVPGAPSASVGLTGTDEITLRWAAPVDNGGEAITGYVVEKTIDNVWTEVKLAGASERTFIEKRGGPGQRTSYRVTAQNILGASPTSAIVTVQVPYDKADAPIGVTATLDANLTRVAVTWQAPEKTGGSAISSYYVQTSRDGSVWSTSGTAPAAARSLTVPAPAKGTSAKYRVVAYTLAAYGNYSAAVSVDVPTTVSSVPRSVSGSFVTDGKLRVTWLAPVDNGGSPITGYTVERLVAGQWQQLATPTTAELILDKEQAGSVVELRITAQNAVGSSAAISWKTNFPFVKSQPVTGLTTQVVANRLQITWAAPEFSGGAPISYYQIERSADAGVTWSNLSYVRSGTMFTTALPAKGKSFKFKVSPITPFGKGESTESELISTSLTVPGAPLVLTSGFDLEGNFKFNWRKPYDDGGSPITGYVIEKQIAGVWTKLAETGADISSITVTRDLPGTVVALRAIAVNSVGLSAASSTYSYKIPALQATAPRNVTVTPNGSSAVKVSWQAPENLGGSDLRQYQVQISRDNGTTWSAYYAAPTASSLAVSAPAKGLTNKYRVVAYTSGAGISQLSEIVSYTNPLTVASPINYLGIYRTTNSVTLNFRAPSDLGGYSSVTYKVQKFVAGVWQDEVPILQLDGPVMTRQLNLPVKGTTTYRVIAVNGSGESTPVQVSIRY